MEWLVREEVALVLATLAGCGLLVLGTLELLWPTRPRRAGRGPRPPLRGPAPGVASASAHRLDPPPALPAEDRRSAALRVARTLLGRAQEDTNPASDRRLTLICRAIACLNRGLEAAPEDVVLRETLATAHEALAEAGQGAALRRLAAEMPGRAPALERAAAALDLRGAGATIPAGV